MLRRYSIMLLLMALSAVCAQAQSSDQRFEVIPQKPPRTAISSYSKNFVKEGYWGDRTFDNSFLQRIKRPQAFHPTSSSPETLKNPGKENNSDNPSSATVSSDALQPEKEQDPQTPTPQTKDSDKSPKDGLTYTTQDPNDAPIEDPSVNPKVRVNPDAPGPIKGMIKALRDGDEQLTDAYADQFVRYQQNYFFEVLTIADRIGKAMIRQKVINEDDWPGAVQMMSYEMALTRKETGDLFKPTNEAALKRIKADPQQQAEVFYFFTLNCSWCRYMAPDVERLWRVTNKDSNVKMTALTLGPTPKDYIKEYRSYTGITMPVYQGTEVAKAFGIGFVPAVVIVSPNTHKAYVKTGQESFPQLYEFLRTVQGLPVQVTAELKELVEEPIGQAEMALAKQKGRKIKITKAKPKSSAVEASQKF